jgi:hypothetical protein
MFSNFVNRLSLFVIVDISKSVSFDVRWRSRWVSSCNIRIFALKRSNVIITWSSFVYKLHLLYDCIYSVIAFIARLHLQRDCIYIAIASTARLHLQRDCIYSAIAFTARLHLQRDYIYNAIAFTVRLHLQCDCIYCAIASTVRLHLQCDCIDSIIASMRIREENIRMRDEKQMSDMRRKYLNEELKRNIWMRKRRKISKCEGEEKYLNETDWEKIFEWESEGKYLNESSRKISEWDWLRENIWMRKREKYLNEEAKKNIWMRKRGEISEWGWLRENI